jgi:putative hydrolase of the HAD superfamily
MRQLFETENRRRVFDQLLLELNCTDAAELVPAMVECYRNHIPDIELTPDAERALARWSGSFFLGLISDGPLRMQQQKVQALGLDRRLNRVILTDQWGSAFWKPHPRAFEAIEQDSGHSRSACAYIADNAAKDFVAPNSRGWRTVRICRPGGVYGEMSPPPGGCEQFQIQSLDEVDIRF